MLKGSSSIVDESSTSMETYPRSDFLRKQLLVHCSPIPGNNSESL